MRKPSPTSVFLLFPLPGRAVVVSRPPIFVCESLRQSFAVYSHNLHDLVIIIWYPKDVDKDIMRCGSGAKGSSCARRTVFTAGRTGGIRHFLRRRFARLWPAAFPPPPRAPNNPAAQAAIIIRPYPSDTASFFSKAPARSTGHAAKQPRKNPALGLEPRAGFLPIDQGDGRKPSLCLSLQRRIPRMDPCVSRFLRPAGRSKGR